MHVGTASTRVLVEANAMVKVNDNKRVGEREGRGAREGEGEGLLVGRSGRKDLATCPQGSSSTWH